MVLILVVLEKQTDRLMLPLQEVAVLLSLMPGVIANQVLIWLM